MRLSSIATRNGGYVLIDLSAQDTLSELLGIDSEVALNQPIFQQLLHLLMPTLSAHSSGVVLEPDQTLPLWSDIHAKTAEPINAGVLLTLADNLQTPAEVPKLDPKWGIEEIKNNYAVALVRLAYHPSEEKALLKKQFLAELKDYCNYQELDVVIDLHLQPIQPTVPPSADDLLTAVQELYKTASAFILPVPGDALSAATITAELDRPWLVRLASPSYETSKDELRLALEAGAKGFLATDFLSGLSAFRNPAAGPDMHGIEQYIHTELRDRILELGRIVAENA